MGESFMRREHAANSRGGQISLKLLAPVLSRAGQGYSISVIPAILVRPRWLRTAGLKFRSSLVVYTDIASRPARLQAGSLCSNDLRSRGKSLADHGLLTRGKDCLPILDMAKTKSLPTSWNSHSFVRSCHCAIFLASPFYL